MRTYGCWLCAVLVLPSLLTLTVSCSTALSAPAGEIEARPAPFQTSPRPADGEILTANPPCFVYPARAAAALYTVEFSEDAGFSAAATRRLSSPYMLAAPSTPLKPGRYFWRWAPVADGRQGARWSTVRSFTVPADAPIVPFPEIEGLVRRIGATRPRIEVRAAELTEMRRRAREAFGPTWLDSIRQYARRMQAKSLLPEPAFLPDPKDPRRIELYQKTFQTVRPFMHELTTLAENYLLTGDELSGQEAKRRLLHVLSWDPRAAQA